MLVENGFLKARKEDRIDAKLVDEKEIGCELNRWAPVFW